jgi:hypothetical protein
VLFACPVAAFTPEAAFEAALLTLGAFAFSALLDPDFVVLADPDGNAFCVVDLGSAPSGDHQ